MVQLDVACMQLASAQSGPGSGLMRTMTCAKLASNQGTSACPCLADKLASQMLLQRALVNCWPLFARNYSMLEIALRRTYADLHAFEVQQAPNTASGGLLLVLVQTIAMLAASLVIQTEQSPKIPVSVTSSSLTCA